MDMKVDKFSRVILSESDICDLYLENPDRDFRYIISDTEIIFDKNLEIKKPKIIKEDNIDHLSVEYFDEKQQNIWYMPEKYKELDIAEYILKLCKNDAELQRAGEELILFQERNMFDLLKYLVYFVDTLREHKIVWGVGRGSSVSSFVLYLIGVHKINSLYYNLSIDEFLK